MGIATIVASTIAPAPAPVELREVPAGTLNGTNATFTLSFTPSPSDLMLTLNGVGQNPAVDYTISGATITFTVPPVSSDWMMAFYTH